MHNSILCSCLTPYYILQELNKGGEMEACAKSSKNCLFIHRKSPSQSPKVSSFFKVMFGKQYSQVLFLPPKFAKKLRLLVGEIMYLRNSGGQKWKVVLSNVSGTLAFQKGWHEFSMNHGIEMGDFVVFHYIEGSLQFFIQIFARSGCERLTSSSKGKSYQKKRVKTTRDTFDSCSRDSAFHTLPSAKKHPSACGVSQPKGAWNDGENNVTKSSPVPGSIPSPENIARGLNRDSERDFLENIMMGFVLDRDMSFDKDGYSKKDFFDLSIFEMPNKKTVVREDEAAASLDGAEKCYITQENEELCSVKKEYSSLPRSCPSTDMPRSSRKTNKPAEMPQKSEFLSRSAGKITVLKQEPRGFIEDVADDSMADYSLGAPRDDANLSVTTGGLHMIVKCEPINVFDFSPPPIASITCYSDSESFLELPEPLPIKACRAVKSEKKMVILRDPIGRLWPVLYHQMNGIKVLASGWAAFRKTNNIQLGDECTFSLANRDEAIFAVTVMTPGNLIQDV